MSPIEAFDADRLRGRVRDKAQSAIASNLEPGETIQALVPGFDAGIAPGKRRRMLGRTRQRLLVATERNIYVFMYRFGKIRDLELKRELGGLPVRMAEEGSRGGGYITVGDLSIRVGASVWSNWRDEARMIVQLNMG